MISAIVLTLNEARHLPDCLASLHWADETIVLDSGSEDGTVEIATAAGAIVRHRPMDQFGAQRAAALGMASHPWVLFVDADERVTPWLADEVRTVTNAGGPEVGWWIPRRNIFWGREIRHSGWAPDEQLRLLRRERAGYDPLQVVHEVPHLDGPAGRLGQPLIHINYESVGEFWVKQAAYARQEGAKLQASGVTWRPHRLLSQPLRAFRRRWITYEGWRDGLTGLGLAAAMAWWEGAAHLELRRLEQKKNGRPGQERPV